MVPPHRRPALRRRREAGILHGLSLVILTALVVAGLAFFAGKELPVRCLCADNSIATGTRGGLEAAKSRCAELCKDHGGGEPAPREKGARK